MKNDENPKENSGLVFFLAKLVRDNIITTIALVLHFLKKLLRTRYSIFNSVSPVEKFRDLQ